MLHRSCFVGVIDLVRERVGFIGVTTGDAEDALVGNKVGPSVGDFVRVIGVTTGESEGDLVGDSRVGAGVTGIFVGAAVGAGVVADVGGSVNVPLYKSFCEKRLLLNVW